jgi:hypothetical protein
MFSKRYRCANGAKQKRRGPIEMRPGRKRMIMLRNIVYTPADHAYHLLAITLGLVIAVRGSRALSLDRLLLNWRAFAPAVAVGPGRKAVHATTSST